MNLITGTEHYIQTGLLPMYYMIVILSNLYILSKFRFNIHAVLVTIIFSEGLFAYLSGIFPLFSYVYKVGYFVLTFLLYGKYLIKHFDKYDKSVNFIFIFIMITFFISALVNNSNILMVSSQLFKKYGIPFIFYHAMKSMYLNNKKMNWYGKLFYNLLIAQIFYSFVKVILFGFGESLVGSISFVGGAPGNIVPVLGFLLIWLRSNRCLSKHDWWIIALLLFFAISGNKRSVLFVMPFIIFLTLIYVDKKVNVKSLIKFSPLLFLLFFISVKTNPTLNPERSRWGSFNISYVANYAYNYTFGSEEMRARKQIGYGRGGGFLEFMRESSDFSVSNFLWGHGISEIIGVYDDFDYEVYNVAYKGAAGAAVQNFIAFGIIGQVLLFLFGISVLMSIPNKELRIILILYLMWDYFLFYNSTVTVNAHGILWIFACMYFKNKSVISDASISRSTYAETIPNNDILQPSILNF
jgi:hypothetical protein